MVAGLILTHKSLYTGISNNMVRISGINTCRSYLWRALNGRFTNKQQIHRRNFFFTPHGNTVSQKVKDFKIKGLLTPPVTPMTDDGDINMTLTGEYMQHLQDFGIPNVFVTGTTGEALSLTVEERKHIAETWVKEGKGKLSSIIVHIGTGNLRESQELARHAEHIGADGIACVGTTYHKPQDLDHYIYYMREVAAAAPDTPFFLYDFQFTTGIPYSAAEFFSLADKQIPTLKGLKHTTPDMVSMEKILVQHGDKYQVLMGTDEYYLEGLVIGIDLTICSSYIGNVINRLKEAYHRGDLKQARIEQQRAISMCNIRSKLGMSLPGFAKAMLRVLDMPVGSPRLPLSPISNEEVTAVKRELTNIGFFDWAMRK